jgi:nucleotide-binding universal stress UspA family protein
MPGPSTNVPPRISRILAPIEFSDRCQAAVRYATLLTRQFGSELLLLHVMGPPPAEMSEDIYRDRVAAAGRKLENFLAEDLKEIPARRLVIKGDPARKIVQYAQDEHADVILMSTHGLGPFRRFLLGSTTAKVLHDAPYPVWTGVHMEEQSGHPFFPMRRILCAADLGPESEKVLAWAAGLQKQTGAELTILHCAPILPNSAVRAAAQEELERLVNQLEVTAPLGIQTGEPAPTICAEARRLSAEVLVIGRGSAAGHFGRLRSNAYAIIRASPCPVVSV